MAEQEAGRLDGADHEEVLERVGVVEPAARPWAKNRASSWRSSASKATSLPPGKAR